MNKRVEIDPDKVVCSKTETTTPQPGEIYRHHGGALYEILGPTLTCAETARTMIAFRETPMKRGLAKNHTFVHTVANFMQPGRFERVR